MIHPLVRGTGGASRLGRVRFWVPFLLVVAGSLWALERLAGPVEAAEFSTIDLRRVKLAAPPGGFCDPRWRSELSATLARFEAPDARDKPALEAIARALGALPFVVEAGEPHVIWPDGLEIPVRLCEPVACVRSGDDFRIVSAEGVIEPGTWPEPPLLDGRPLPVIGPNDGAFDRKAPGAHLAERRHQDALAVALSMRSGLSASDAATLGPLLIDATRSPETSVEEPGTLLEFGAKRLALFGRAPGSGQPGELPDELKWRSLAKAAALLRSEGTREPQDWSVVDLRWDTPALRMRHEPPPGPDSAAPKPSKNSKPPMPAGRVHELSHTQPNPTLPQTPGVR
ncbi:MAG: hypothetical protein IPJ19_11990 [Planctomycetes bacterium]|nr:hypothetical protein [Planctomycetota bacterium]